MDSQTESRILGLASLALGLFGVFAPYRWHKMPPVVTDGALVLAVALFLATVWTAIPLRAKRRTPMFMGVMLVVAGLLIAAGGARLIQLQKDEWSKHQTPASAIEPARTPPEFQLKAAVLDEDYPKGSDVYGIKWNPGYSRVQVVLDNPSDKAYDNVDLLITLDRSIIEGRHASAFNECKLGPPTAAPEMVMHGADEAGKAVTIPVTPSHGMITLTPTYRLQCPRVAPHSQILIALATVKFEGGFPNFDQLLAGPRSDPTLAHLLVTYDLKGIHETWAMDIEFPPQASHVPQSPQKPMPTSTPKTVPEAASRAPVLRQPEPAPRTLPAAPSQPDDLYRLSADQQAVLLEEFARLRDDVTNSTVRWVALDGDSLAYATDFHRVLNRAGLHPNPRMELESPNGLSETGVMIEVSTETPKSVTASVMEALKKAGVSAKIVSRPATKVPLVIFVGPKPLR